jgi:peptide/nickel transport system permease protein
MNQFQQMMDILLHMILPMTVLVMTSIGGLMRYSRTNMLEVLNADYIRTARAKGLSENTVIYKHAFRNTMIPLVTILGGSLPGLFAGAMITETIFAIPGLGRAGLNAITLGDIPYIMAYNMFLAVLTLLGTLIADVTYAVVDPRIRLS